MASFDSIRRWCTLRNQKRGVSVVRLLHVRSATLVAIRRAPPSLLVARSSIIRSKCALGCEHREAWARPPEREQRPVQRGAAVRGAVGECDAIDHIVKGALRCRDFLLLLGGSQDLSRCNPASTRRISPSEEAESARVHRSNDGCGHPSVCPGRLRGEGRSGAGRAEVLAEED